MNVPILLLGLVSLVAGILLLVLGRRRRLNRAATTGWLGRAGWRSSASA